MTSDTIPYLPRSLRSSERAPVRSASLPAPPVVSSGRTLVPAGRFAAAPAATLRHPFHVLRGGRTRPLPSRRPTVELRVCALEATEPTEDARDTNVLPTSRREETRGSIVVSRRTGQPSDPPAPRRA